MSFSPSFFSCCSPERRNPEHGPGFQGMCVGRELSRRLSWGVRGRMKSEPSAVCLGSSELCVCMWGAGLGGTHMTKINHFREYNSVVFSTFTVLCKHHHSVV